MAIFNCYVSSPEGIFEIPLHVNNMPEFQTRLAPGITWSTACQRSLTFFQSDCNRGPCRNQCIWPSMLRKLDLFLSRFHSAASVHCPESQCHVLSTLNISHYKSVPCMLTLSTCPSSLLSCMESASLLRSSSITWPAFGSSRLVDLHRRNGSGDSTWPVRPKGSPHHGSSFMALKCKLFTVVHHMSTLFAISPVSGCPGNIHSHWPVVWWPSTWYHRWKWLPWLLARLWKATSSIFVSRHNWKHSPVFFPVAQYKTL